MPANVKAPAGRRLVLYNEGGGLIGRETEQNKGSLIYPGGVVRDLGRDT